MDEDAASRLFQKMLRDYGIEDHEKIMQLPDSLIKEFRKKTNLPIRKIAAITGINKDRVNKILRNL